MARRKTAPPQSAQPEYLTAAQVRERIGVSTQTLSYWRSRNEGPLSIKLGGSVRYPVVEFEAWLAEQHDKTARGEKVSA